MHTCTYKHKHTYTHTQPHSHTKGFTRFTYIYTLRYNATHNVNVLQFSKALKRKLHEAVSIEFLRQIFIT